MRLNIFKKKAGGSFFGNLIRSVTATLPGGNLFNRYVNPTPDEHGESKWFDF